MPDGGYFDQLDSDSQWLDPRKMAWSGWAQGFGQAAMPTRMPTPIGAVLGMGAGAAQAAGDQAFKNRLYSAESTGKNLGNANELITLNLWRQMMGQPPLSAADLAAGRIDGGGSGAARGGGNAAASTSSSTSAMTPTPDMAAAGVDTNAPGWFLRPGAIDPTKAAAARAAPATTAPTGGGTYSPASVMKGIPGFDPAQNTFMGIRLPAGMSPQAYMALTRLNPQASGRVIGNQYPGPTDYERAAAVAAQNPGDPNAQLAAAKAAGINPTPDLRQGGEIRVWNPVTRQFDVGAKNPVLGEGVQLDEHGNAVTVPNYVRAAMPVRSMEAGAKAQFEPLDVQDAQGNHYTINRAALASATTQKPAGTPALAPSAKAAPAAAPAIPLRTPNQIFTEQIAPKTASAPEPAPTAPNAATPVQFADTLPKTLGELLPPGYQPPGRPAPPRGFMGEPSKGLEESQKIDADRLASYEREQSGGQKIYTNVQQMYQILDRGLNTNELAPSATRLANLAQGMGLGSLVPKNYDPNDAAAYNKLATDLVFTALKQLPGQPRVAEIEGLQKANPSLSMPPAANREILNNVLADQRWKDSRARLGKQYFQTYGGTLGDFDQQFNAKVPQVDYFNTLTEQAARAGAQLPGMPGTPSGGPAASKPQPVFNPTKTYNGKTYESIGGKWYEKP